jgi:hypothetical protein
MNSGTDTPRAFAKRMAVAMSICWPPPLSIFRTVARLTPAFSASPDWLIKDLSNINMQGAYQYATTLSR